MDRCLKNYFVSTEKNLTFAFCKNSVPQYTVIMPCMCDWSHHKSLTTM